MFILATKTQNFLEAKGKGIK